ncbi:Extracellular glycosidase CRH11 [Candida viswanathii]|uniref:Extracellular glycosidase CRH11 n=1 Tax=Candida viswanathii TaxID=5486 RepID=A0A367Y047_9ASCO|nr:Extracellular glycosidase CRH11 [Candida viswanathii]
MFGHVEVVLKAGEGKSDDLDEIDIELFGGDPYQWQSNYFIKGNTATYDRGGYHDISNPLENYHTYVIDWTEDAVTWSVDGSVIRTLPKDNAQGFPQSPMAIYAGIWAGGDPGNEEGTIQWAGGITDYSQAPFTMHIKSVLVADYSTSGTWESIDAEDGEVNGRYDEAQEDIQKLLSGQSVDSGSNSGSSSILQVQAAPSTSSTEVPQPPHLLIFIRSSSSASPSSVNSPAGAGTSRVVFIGTTDSSGHSTSVAALRFG